MAEVLRERPTAGAAAPARAGSARLGWSIVCAYAGVCAVTQLLWLTFAPITTSSSHYYGVSANAIGWLAEIFPLLYVALAVPAGLLLDRLFRPSLSLGGALVVLGGLLRLGGHTFAWALAGQALVALAQPLVLSAVSKLAGEYLAPGERSNGIALGTAGNFAGMLLALILGPTVGAHGHIERLLVIEAALAIAPAFALAVLLRRRGAGNAEHAAIEGNAVRALWRMPQLRKLTSLVFVGFGIFVALATWLQQLLQPAGVSERGAGALLVGMVLAGVVGCALLPALVERRAAQRTFLELAVVVSCAACVALALAGTTWARSIAIAAMGFVLLPALPVILTEAERLAGAAAGTAGAIVWLAGNLGGLLVAVLVQALVHHPTAAFIAMAVVALAGLPIAARLPALGREPARLR